MRVEVYEHGERPTLGTRARISAPQGANALADLFAPHEFAHYAIITLDWTGDMLLAVSQGELARPVMHVLVARYHPEFDRRREVEWVIDLEDAFSLDNMDNAVLRDIVQQAEEQLNQPAPVPSDEVRILQA
jgi:hypothetical protein